MKSLVLFDSAYGNTAKVAYAIGAVFARSGETVVKPINAVHSADLRDTDLITLGSPTQGGRPTHAMEEFIDELPAEVTDHANIAVFDTRFEAKDQNKGLQVLMKVIGYAAPKMAKRVVRQGGHLVSRPEGYIVQDKEGPLRDGEMERATQWAHELVDAQ